MSKTQTTEPSVSKGNHDLTIELSPEHPIGLIAKSLPQGESVVDLVSTTITPVMNLLARQGLEPDRAQKEAFALVMAHTPTTAQELVLASQMALVHVSMNTVTGQLQSAEYVETVDSFGNLLTKLGRLSIEQTNSLQKLKGRGQQKIVVEKVNVENGGQAAIGNFEQGGSTLGKK